MKIFLDFEFIENGYGKPIHPLSVGMVREDGAEYYAEYSGAPLFIANDFVRTNVLPNMKSYVKYYHVLADRKAIQKDWGDHKLPEFRATDHHTIREEIIKFVGEKPQFWGYFCDYDWVCLCLTMGKMSQLPNDWPMYCLDLKQEMVMRHISKEEICIEHPQPNTHNALDDAKWNQLAHRHIEVASGVSL